MDFLNSILENDIVKITEIKSKNMTMLGQQIADRNSIFDWYCITKSGERILVALKTKNNCILQIEAYFIAV